jgi:hypothetical protein
MDFSKLLKGPISVGFNSLTVFLEARSGQRFLLKTITKAYYRGFVQHDYIPCV